MPRTAHEELARSDPRLPGLDVLLDPDAVGRLLDSLLPPDVERPTGVEVYPVSYRRGTGLTTRLTVHYPDGPRPAFARALPPDSPAGLTEAVRYARGWERPASGAVDVTTLTEPRLRGPVWDSDLGVVLGPPVDDRALSAVRHLAAVPRGFLARDGEAVRTLAYRPALRWTGRIDDGADRPTAVVRARSGRVNAAAHLAAAAAGVPVADLLRVSRYGLLAVRWLPGEPLDRRCARDPEARPTLLARTGELLALLHSVPPPRELPPADPANPVAAAAAQVGELVPGLAGRAEAVARRCARVLADPAAPRVLVHGDLAPGRVLADTDRVTLTGLAEARTAHPATDLADLAAAGCPPGSDSFPVTVPEPLLAGYLDACGATVAAQVSRGLGAGLAAALLCRASEPFHRGADDWDLRVAAAVDAAEAALHDR